MIVKSKYLFYTDTHLDNISIYSKIRFIKDVRQESPAGIFLTGDIADGGSSLFYLEILAKFIKCPIYFILGNHCYWFSSIPETNEKVKLLCQKYSNLIYMQDQNVIKLNEESCLIGINGWYDASLGNPEYLKFTLDWLLIKDFRSLSSMSDRIERFRRLADESCVEVKRKIELALEQGYKNIYLLTHFPPWKEATRDEGTFFEPFWLPYNVNLRLGKALENVMADRKKKHLAIFCGHVHQPVDIFVSRNIECHVGAALEKHKLFI